MTTPLSFLKDKRTANSFLAINHGRYMPETEKRTKDPSYVVLVEKIGTDPDDPRRWVLLTPSPIKASSRKAAIIAVATPDETDGTYGVVPAKDWKPIRRASRQVTIDEFE